MWVINREIVRMGDEVKVSVTHCIWSMEYGIILPTHAPDLLFAAFEH